MIRLTEEYLRDEEPPEGSEKWKKLVEIRGLKDSLSFLLGDSEKRDSPKFRQTKIDFNEQA